jgi:hypothetical protein
VVTRYRVLVSEELTAQIDELDLPQGFTFADAGTPAGDRFYSFEVEDDNAPADLEGRLVDVTFQRNFITGEVTVMSRTAVKEL